MRLLLAAGENLSISSFERDDLWILRRRTVRAETRPRWNLSDRPWEG